MGFLDNIFSKKQEVVEPKIERNLDSLDKKDNTEDFIFTEFEHMENKEQEVLSLLNEVGGPEGIQKILEAMNSDKIKELNEKIKEAADKHREYGLDSSETMFLVEIPAMVSGLFFWLSQMPTTTPMGERSSVVALFLAGLAAAIPVLFSAHLWKEYGELSSGIGSAIKAMKENRKWKKLVAEKDELITGQTSN